MFLKLFYSIAPSSLSMCRFCTPSLIQQTVSVHLGITINKHQIMPQKTNQIRTAFILFPGHPKQPHGFLVRCPEALGSKFKEFYFKGLNSWTKPLTHWLLVYKLIVLGNRGKKTGIFRLTYQLHSSSANCARELFKPSKDLASLQVRSEKNFLVLGFFVSDIISKVSFWPFFAGGTWPGPNHYTEVFHWFSLETRIESKSFEILTNFLEFLVRKLWSKINKQNNYLHMGLITLFFYFRS